MGSRFRNFDVSAALHRFSRSRAHAPRNPGCHLSMIVMLPDHNDIPAELSQRVDCFFVSLDIARQFGGPSFRIGSRRRPVIWAAMPETAPNVDRYHRPREDDVHA
jgi:hypothetical protein